MPCFVSAFQTCLEQKRAIFSWSIIATSSLKKVNDFSQSLAVARAAENEQNAGGDNSLEVISERSSSSLPILFLFSGALLCVVRWFDYLSWLGAMERLDNNADGLGQVTLGGIKRVCNKYISTKTIF